MTKFWSEKTWTR